MNDYNADIPDEFIYCNVLVFEDIFEGPDKKYYTTQRDLCLMAKYRYFDLYF